MGILATAKKGVGTATATKKAKTAATETVAPTATKVVDTTTLSPMAQRVNTLIQLHKDMEAKNVFALLKEYEAAKKACAEYAKDSPTDDALILEGTEGYLSYSAKSDSTVLTDKTAVIAMLGQDVFNQLAKLTITDLKKYLNQTQLDLCTSIEKGSRSLKAVVPKDPE